LFCLARWSLLRSGNRRLSLELIAQPWRYADSIEPKLGYANSTRRGTAKKMSKRNALMPPVHPGEILREDFIKPLGLSVNKLELELHVPATRIGEIIHGRRRITAETALRLARYFRTNAEFWLNLQNFYDLEVTRRSGKV